jgi:hypothetical protein
MPILWGREIKRKAKAGNYMNWNMEIRQNNSQKLNNPQKKESNDIKKLDNYAWQLGSIHTVPGNTPYSMVPA